MIPMKDLQDLANAMRARNYNISAAVGVAFSKSKGKNPLSSLVVVLL